MATFKEPKFFMPPGFLSAGACGDGASLDFMKRDPDPCFPAEFPYDFCSSPAESEEEEYLAGLARRIALDTLKFTAPVQNDFEKWLHLSSPESTLGRVTGSSNTTPNGPSQISSPTTPLGAKNDSLDLLLQAAGEVARLKMSAVEEHLMGHRLTGHPTFSQIPPAVKPQTGRLHGYIEPHLSQTRATAIAGGVRENSRYARAVMGVSGNAAALRSLHFPLQNLSGRPVMPFSSGGGKKKERAGTGVFLPRRYGTTHTNHHPKDPGGKTGCCTTAKVVHGRHNNFQAFNGSVRPQLNGNFLSDYEMLLARRNAAMVAQQRRNFVPEMPLSHEVSLPQEWTY